MKHLYRVIVFLVFFCGSVFLFSGSIREVHVEGTKTKVDLSQPSFPIMVVKTQGYNINILHGYNSNLKASLIRESMTPIGIEQEFQLLISENGVNVRKLKYELRKVNDNSLMDSGEISVMEETKEGKVATVRLNAAIEQGKEYAFKVTTISTEGEKIHYFTRVKFYGSESYLQEKMDFVMDFHEKTLKKEKAGELSGYLEYSAEKKNDNYAEIDIHSSVEMVTWGDLEPEIVSEIVPTIKEFNIETAAISLEYFVKIKSGDGNDLCRVKEFYRVRYSAGRLYLLKFNRNMETLFDIEDTSISESEFKIGITPKSNIEMLYNQEKNRLAFAVGGELWSYNLTENKATRVFSFMDTAQLEECSSYNQHAFRVIKLKNNGDMDFMVYGYMNRGDYEGCVGLILYKYFEAEKRVEEQLFIPMETTYQILKENLDQFSYVSDGNIFYFAVSNVIYSYDLVAKRLSVIAKQVAEGDYCYVEEAGVLAWQENSNDVKSKEVVLMDLETKKRISITAEEKERVLLIGNIDNNIVYGIAREEDISEDTDGTKVTPMYRVCIVDKTGKELKVYEQENIYVTSATVVEEIVQMERAKKEGNGFVKIKSDSIQNINAGKEPEMGVNFRISELGLKEYYIYLTAGYTMDKAPKVNSTKTTLINESKIVRLQGNESKYSRYYVYAEGEIKRAFSSPSKAINAAEEWMGVVINEDNQIVYERAGKYKNNQIGNIGIIATGNGVNYKGACVAMILKYNHIAANAGNLSESKKTAYSLLKKKMKEANVISLKGCTLDEVLYFVSNNRPVIACLDNNVMYLITEYTESAVTYINPANGKKEVKSIRAASEMFENAGNVFISYVQ